MDDLKDYIISVLQTFLYFLIAVVVLHYVSKVFGAGFITNIQFVLFIVVVLLVGFAVAHYNIIEDYIVKILSYIKESLTLESVRDRSGRLELPIILLFSVLLALLFIELAFYPGFIEHYFFINKQLAVLILSIGFIILGLLARFSNYFYSRLHYFFKLYFILTLLLAPFFIIAYLNQVGTGNIHISLFGRPIFFEVYASNTLLVTVMHASVYAVKKNFLGSQFHTDIDLTTITREQKMFIATAIAFNLFAIVAFVLFHPTTIFWVFLASLGAFGIGLYSILILKVYSEI